MSEECDYPNFEDCDLRNDDGECTLDTHPMEYCPAEEEEDEDDD